MDEKKPNHPLSIDLNEIPPEAANPSSPDLDAYGVVRRIHGQPAPPAGPAAEHPGEAGGAGAEERACGFCGRPELRGATVVCDGCERGFHLGCLRRRHRNRVLSGDWICGECALTGPTKNRWALGAVDPGRMLDINRLPPLDGNAADEQRRVKDTDKDFLDGRFSVLYPYPNVGIAFDHGDHSDHTVEGAHNVRTCSEVITKHGFNTGTCSENLVLVSSLRGRSAANTATVSGQLKEELFLCSLKDFITEKGGVLGEGWHVEIKQSPTGFDSYAVYCAPDGMKFESMFEVAQYLGISFGFTLMETDEKSDGCGTVQRLLTPRKRKRDLKKISAKHNVNENKHGVRSSFGRELLSETESAPQCSGVRSAPRVPNTYTEENGVYKSENLVELPVQYEDFFITCLGKVDLRMAYHDKYQIWPLGYRSSWHDKVTGSLFECEVSDGGDSGPVFRVRRYPCSLSSIPNGSTILKHNKAKNADIAEKTQNVVIFDADYSKDDDILMLLSNPSPLEKDLLSCYDHDSSGNSYGSSIRMDTDYHPEQKRGLSGKNTGLRDEIGEFFVEGSSPSSVWKMVTQTLIGSCQEVYKQLGCLQFCCRHDDGLFSSCLADGTVKDVHCVGTLSRFHGACGAINTQVIRSDNELEESCKLLTEWLNHDRFGFDIGFVQEIIETLPASRACSGYQFLNERNDFSLSWTVGSGFLLATQRNTKSGCEEIVSYGLYGGKHSSGQQECAEDPFSADRHPPPGRPLSSNLPAELVGDIFQISEVLWRFYEVLGLKEVLSFEELEEELIDPWPCYLNNLSRVEREKLNPNNQTLPGSESANCTGSLHAGACDHSINGKNLFRSIPVDLVATMEAAQDKLASQTCRRCTGVALTKAHVALLKVLVGELVSKVAAYLDPNLDARESKPRRGRKKEMENSFRIKELKSELLSINELTWPELARRYVLAVQSMKGCMESQEGFVRESVKVFRCLQGDGGVLSGSLPGIAGMEADSLLLAEAERQITVTSKLQNEVLLPVDYKNNEEVGTSEPTIVMEDGLPEWAKLLEPVRKLPTNVGTRIRRCIQSALEKNPPQWAKERLVYSISKEVYKGNASGPTKKAALSVLAEAAGIERQQHKPDMGKKEIKPTSVSDIIMKKCRIVLRLAASEDESKTFCNLLGSTLLNSNDNDDEGIVGSPAMVSRPLDFRTIDLRLAVGAYCGSHETFLEDAREVWHNLCIAYGDRPDMSQKIESLSQNFESLYEKEVLHLIHRLVDLCSVEQLDAETLKVLNDVLVGAIPKAPWEDGVCKVCGIDKDDVSVLLCDRCDSEYHKYCLNPPLARIPEGNWYCPSCVMGQRRQEASQYTQNVKKRPRRRKGDGNWSAQEPLNRLAATMEEREYWEFSTEERIMLLKFLCDEVLNSTIIREHLEQCVEQSNDLQQKMRSLPLEWRNLKFKEELLAMRSANEYSSRSCITGDVLREGGATAMFADQGSLTGQQNFSSKVIDATSILGSPLNDAIRVEDNGRAVNKELGHLLNSVIEKHAKSNIPWAQFFQLDSVAAEGGTQSNDILSKITIHENPLSTISNGCESNGQESIVVSPQQLKRGGGEVVLDTDYRDIQSRLLDVSKNIGGSNVRSMPSVETNGIVQSKADKSHGSNLPSDNGTTHLRENDMTMVCGASMASEESPSAHQNKVMEGNQFNVHAVVNESEACNLELTTLKNEISQLQDSFASLESQLMMTSLRREFIGRDSVGRSYWVIGKAGERPRLVVGGSIPLKRRKATEMSDFSYPGTSCSFSHYDNIRQLDGDSSVGLYYSSPLVFYESDVEFQQLVAWLRDNDSRERELKENILQCQRLLFYQGNIPVSNDPNLGLNLSSEKNAAPQCSTTKAATVLENKYGPCLDLEVSKIPKECGRKAKVTNEERMYRCECLEPVWSCRYHCLSCHKTYCTVEELEAHNDGSCSLINLSFDLGKGNDDSIKGKGKGSESTREKDHADALDSTETSRKDKFDTVDKFVKFQKKPYPFDFNEICKKFVVNDSLKESVKEIGLIGSHGVPSLISSPPMFFDPPSLLNQKKCDNDQNTLPMFTQSEVDKDKSGREHEIKSLKRCNGDGKGDLLPKTTTKRKGAVGHEASKVQGSKCSQSCMIPESSLRPLVGKVSHILKRLKINLLDMDAALPEEALRPSKSNLVRRCAWREFVKSAESIFEMVQATILLELMIKSEYLKNGWWYWSSLTAAAKTPTVSSLALRIYTLDDSIIYLKDKDPPLLTSLEPPAETLQLINRMAGKNKKDMAEAGPT